MWTRNCYMWELKKKPAIIMCISIYLHIFISLSIYSIYITFIYVYIRLKWKISDTIFHAWRNHQGDIYILYIRTYIFWRPYIYIYDIYQWSEAVQLQSKERFRDFINKEVAWFYTIFYLKPKRCFDLNPYKIKINDKN